jgi:heme O synthase-like polyprenyltransferase
VIWLSINATNCSDGVDGVSGSLTATAITILGGLLYTVIATALGLVFIGVAALFARERSVATARRLFLFSILYLPLLWAALVVDRLIQ